MKGEFFKMKHDEFVGEVQNRARLASRGEAERAVRATLETMAERLAGGEADHLAAQLPQEIGRHLQGANGGERFSLDEFFQRVSQKEKVDLPESVYHCRAVIEVLREAVSPGEFANMRAQLPDEYNRLLEAGSEGTM
jgi:uncharacterized protein (DUF2267 family)